jgi:uncharacterized protein (TIGR02284 family)
MQDYQQRIIETLNALLAVCNDNVEGLTEAAKQIEAEDFQRPLGDLAEQWRKIAEGLRAEVIYRGGEPVESGTLLGDAQRYYAKLKAALVTNERRVIVDELQQLSARALSKFDTALQGGSLPPQADSIIQLQRGQVQGAHERILALRDHVE